RPEIPQAEAPNMDVGGDLVDDQVARDNEEDVDADVSARRARQLEMARDHRENRDRAQPVDERLVGMNVVRCLDRGFCEQHAKSSPVRCKPRVVVAGIGSGCKTRQQIRIVRRLNLCCWCDYRPLEFWEHPMQLPRRMIDLSSPLDNETILDHPFMRPKIEYRTNAENAPMLLDIFPGLRREHLPEGEAWAFELVQPTTHNGTHMDAPVHYQSKTIDGQPMMTIDQVPLDWFFRPGVKLDFRKMPDGHVVTGAEVEAELARIG